MASASRDHPKAGLPRIPPADEQPAKPWVPGKTQVRRRGGASAAVSAAPRSTPGRGAAMVTGAPRPPCPAPPGVVGGRAYRPGLVSSNAAEEAPARPRWWAPQEGGQEAPDLPCHRPLTGSGRGEEMAPEATMELPACLA